MAQNSKWPGTDHLGSGKRRRDVLDRDLLGCSVEGGTAALSEKRETEQRVEGCRDAGRTSLLHSALQSEGTWVCHSSCQQSVLMAKRILDFTVGPSGPLESDGS